MNREEKILVRIKVAATFRKILSQNREIAIQSQKNGIKNFSLVDSIRKLEASSRLSYTIVQGVLAADREVNFSSLLSLIGDGLNMTLKEFAELYESISKDDLDQTKKEIEESKKPDR